MPSDFCGYVGDYLDIDLSTGKNSIYEISNDDKIRFLGNKGIGAKILYDNLKPGIDPLSAENILILNTGPLVGSGAPCSSRFNVSSKSVMTGGIAHSNCGGTFGIYLKKAGYDGVIIRGKSEIPVYITISEKKVEIHDARHIWGMDSEKTQEELKKEYGRHTGMTVIGPAGENLVRYASIVSGERVAGRTGVGAVMGSKNLKAIVTWGDIKVPVYNKAAFTRAIKSWITALKANPITGKSLAQFGTANLVDATSATNTLATKNFSRGTWEKSSEINGEKITETDWVKNGNCKSCPIRCERRVKVDGKEVKGPEFETVGLWGSNILNDSLKNIYKWNYLMDLYGMDTISCGGSIAFAMELNEKGLWKNGLEFGKFENIEQTLEDIAYRRGIGDDLAEGTMRMSEKYGGKEFAHHAKGLEFAAYEPRGAVGHGLGYATAPRGGCHIDAGYLVFFEALGPLTFDPLTPKLKPAFTMFNQNAMDAVSSAGNCIFTTYAIVPGFVDKVIPPHSVIARVVGDVLISARVVLNLQDKLEDWMVPINVPLIPQSNTLKQLTGMDMTLGKFLLVGERVHLMARMFNLREGFTKEDDDLPARIKTPQREDEPNSFVNINEMRPVFYKVRGYDEEGFPTEKTLKKLNMEFLLGDVHEIKNKRDVYRKNRALMRKEENKYAKNKAGGIKKYTEELIKLRDEMSKQILKLDTINRNAELFGKRFFVDNSNCRACGLCYQACPVDAVVWKRDQKAYINQEICVKCAHCFFACPLNFNAINVMEDKELYNERAEIIYKVDEELCISCGRCKKSCAVDAVDWEKKQKSHINPELCIRCGRCQITCPVKPVKAISKVSKKDIFPIVKAVI